MIRNQFCYRDPGENDPNQGTDDEGNTDDGSGDDGGNGSYNVNPDSGDIED